ncbi:hypothetical protein Hypma_011097 [Hypsizygus marmoreus]|uniref:Uncharacterized protein n=1 Tax=Hypsizygus marmoreus TaxID=39966 RepID=A0A369JMI6_HYPMA|nr:hypothetical protein Hypma_011097 [Hypsizygus marmoreus]
MSSSKSNGQLNLDPGAPPRRKSISGCKCLLLTVGIVTLLGIGVFVLIFLATTARSLLMPHRELYHNTSLENLTHRGSVVQPLITREQTFDLAATVWLRTSEKGTHRDGELRAEDKGKEELGKASREEEDDSLVETPLYSNIVFRGVRLTDKNLATTVNFSVPTSIFRNANLTNYDLRGSIVLVPTPPSMLDHLFNYSTWLPDTIDALPVRSWPFPLGSADRGDKTLADKAMESFGVSIPLIQFNGIQSQCMKSDDRDIAEDSTDDEDDIDIEDLSDPVVPKPKNPSVPSSLRTTNGQPSLKSHPYIVTRTQIRVVDETKLFQRKAYLKAHIKLKESSCGQKALAPPNFFLCERKYGTNGHWETQLQLRVLNETTGKTHTEWAYAPYISVSTFAFGQKDLVAIPVNRLTCSSGSKASDPVPETDSVDVSWKLSYSGRTPGKLVLAEMSETPKWYSFNETEYAQRKAHGEAELSNGIFGHKFDEKSHPRRRFSLMTLQTFLYPVIFILDVRYWFTCKSTVSISIPGTIVISASRIIEELAGVITKGQDQKISIPGWLGAFLFSFATQLVVPLLMLKAVARVEFSWWKDTTWIPVIQRAGATHSERASERLEAQLSWHFKIGLFLSLLANGYLLSPQKYHIIPAVFPDPTATKPDLGILSSLVDALYLTGYILQLLMNWRSQTFAGSYRLTAVLMAIMCGTVLAEYMPALVGTFDLRPALSAYTVVGFALDVVNVWQALTLRRVPLSHDLDEGHIE